MSSQNSSVFFLHFRSSILTVSLPNLQIRHNKFLCLFFRWIFFAYLHKMRFFFFASLLAFTFISRKISYTNHTRRRTLTMSDRDNSSWNNLNLQIFRKFKIKIIEVEHWRDVKIIPKTSIIKKSQKLCQNLENLESSI